jgi:hypothetical protein
VPYKHPSGRQQHDAESLALDAEQCEDEEVAQSVSHSPLGEVFGLRCVGSSSVGHRAESTIGTGKIFLYSTVHGHRLKNYVMEDFCEPAFLHTCNNL